MYVSWRDFGCHPLEEAPFAIIFLTFLVLIITCYLIAPCSSILSCRLPAIKLSLYCDETLALFVCDVRICCETKFGNVSPPPPCISRDRIALITHLYFYTSCLLAYIITEICIQFTSSCSQHLPHNLCLDFLIYWKSIVDSRCFFQNTEILFDCSVILSGATHTRFRLLASCRGLFVVCDLSIAFLKHFTSFLSHLLCFSCRLRHLETYRSSCYVSDWGIVRRLLMSFPVKWICLIHSCF